MFPSHPPALCRDGVIATPHHLASLAGARVLMEGGNAVDAAVAAGAVLTVVYPQNCTLGGDAFWLIYDARAGRVRALNGCGRAPARATPEWFRAHGLAAMARRGILSVTVPGVVDSWAEALERFGSRPLAALLEPAIAYAADGFAVSAKLAQSTVNEADVLRADPAASAIFLPGGQPLAPGSVLRQPELADTLRRLAAHGRDEFYRGETARAIAAAAQALDGLLDERDLAAHRSDWVEPIRTSYRGLEIRGFPPPTQGVAALMLLNVMEGFDLAALGPGSPDLLHRFAEAKKVVYPDRDRHLADPAFVDVPVARLLSKEYARELRARIDPRRAALLPAAADGRGETIYLCAADRWGNAVSLIQSVYSDYGSGVVAPGTGVLLQNRGSSFTLDPTHANRLAPGKRPFHTLIPAMALRDGRPWLIYGSAGGSLQPQVQAQLLTNVVDFGMDVQQALDAPRWAVGGMDHDDREQELRLEAPLAELAGAELEARGQRVVPCPAWSDDFGHAHAIRVHHDSGVLEAGADPRSDGAAIGW